MHALHLPLILNSKPGETEGKSDPHTIAGITSCHRPQTLGSPCIDDDGSSAEVSGTGWVLPICRRSPPFILKTRGEIYLGGIFETALRHLNA